MAANTPSPDKPLVPVTPRGEATRKKLLASATTEFCEKGFHAASVSSITQRADVGQGTFYLYFHSKEEVYATLVRELGTAQRHRLAALAPSAGKASERTVVEALIGDIAGLPGHYRILREAQFVDERVFRETQDQLHEAVATLLPPHAVLRAAALVGATEQVALRHCLWAEKPVNAQLAEAELGR